MSTYGIKRIKRMVEADKKRGLVSPNLSPKTMQALSNSVLKKIYNQGRKYPLPPLRCVPRTLYRGDDCYFFEYGFLRGEWTDEEVKELMDKKRITINSPYDCTGYAFTVYIDWHRNPNGSVSFVHCKGRDI